MHNIQKSTQYNIVYFMKQSQQIDLFSIIIEFAIG